MLCSLLSLEHGLDKCVRLDVKDGYNWDKSSVIRKELILLSCISNPNIC